MFLVEPNGNVKLVLVWNSLLRPQTMLIDFSISIKINGQVKSAMYVTAMAY